MPDIQIPLPFDELQCKPPLSPKVSVDDRVSQVLALLSGYDGVQRKLVKVSQSGVLLVAAPPLKDIYNFTASGAGDNWQGANVPCSECTVIAHPDNTGLVWVNKDAVAAPDTGIPLAAGKYCVINPVNLLVVHVHIVTDTEKAIICWTE